MLAEVTFEEFMKWIGFFEGNPRRAKGHILQAAREVPLIAKLLQINANAHRQGASSQELDRATAVVSALLAIHFALEGHGKPSISKRRVSNRRRRS